MKHWYRIPASLFIFLPLQLPFYRLPSDIVISNLLLGLSSIGCVCACYWYWQSTTSKAKFFTLWLSLWYVAATISFLVYP